MASSYIILVNWNGHHDTIECLESLLRLADEEFHIVIVDNGSTDGSIDAFRRWSVSAPEYPVVGAATVWATMPPQRRHAASLRVVGRDAEPGGDTRITIIEAGENLGFAGANNMGLALAARDVDCKWLWVLNNDTVVAPDTLSTLVAHGVAHPGQAIIGATLLYYHNPVIVQGLGGWLEPKRARAGHIGAGLAVDALPDPPEVERQLAYVMGASMFVRRTAYDVIGGMSEDYFLYYEELEWARQLPAGMTQGWSRDAVVFHKEGGSIGTSSTAHRPSDTSLYYLRRGALRFYWRHERLYFPLAVARIMANLAYCTKRGDRTAIRVTIRAFIDALTGRFRRGPFGSAEFYAAERRRIHPATLE